MTTAAVKERPILFSAPMVRAILEGRKTQTRRVIKPAPGEHPDDDGSVTYRCPYGFRGDRLWVRETFSYVTLCKNGDPWTAGAKRDGTYREMPDGNPLMMVYRASNHHAPSWKPSIFMPRWASRILLEIETVHAQRLQDITPEDILAEGLPTHVHPLTWKKARRDSWREDLFPFWRKLWDNLNAARGFGWDKNPWVFRIEFRRVS